MVLTPFTYALLTAGTLILLALVSWHIRRRGAAVPLVVPVTLLAMRSRLAIRRSASEAVALSMQQSSGPRANRAIHSGVPVPPRRAWSRLRTEVPYEFER